MDIVEKIKEFLLPELEGIRIETHAMGERLGAVERLLVDQNQRVDDTNRRIDELRHALSLRLEAAHHRLDDIAFKMGSAQDAAELRAWMFRLQEGLDHLRARLAT